jgi:hypothetical protein
MAVANSLSYYNMATITAVKSLIVQAPLAGLMNLVEEKKSISVLNKISISSALGSAKWQILNH